jgi:hypothetical protein
MHVSLALLIHKIDFKIGIKLLGMPVVGCLARHHSPDAKKKAQMRM